MTRTDTPSALDERAIMQTVLDYTRDTAIAKVEDLSDEQAQQALLASSPLMTPGGIVNHLRWVENWWLEIVLLDRPDVAPMTEDDPDKEFRLGLTTPIADIVAGYRDQIQRSNAVIADHDLEVSTALEIRSKPLNLRWILTHLIEETARHNGHLDLIREQLDGTTGS